MDDQTIRMMQLSKQGYACSQIMMQLALDLRGGENPALIRSMAGLAYGCGSGGGSCGVLTGGACVIGLYAAKGADGESESDRFMPMLQQLSDWFSETVGRRHGGVTCDAIVGETGAVASQGTCGQIVLDTFAKVIEILMENEFDPAG